MKTKDQLEQILNNLYWLVEHGKIKEGVEVLNTIQMGGDVMPGCWSCQKCGFVLQKSILHAGSGSISANNEPFNEPCPNDGTLMRPLTYRQAFEDIAKTCEGQIKRAVAAEEAHNKVTAMVARFLVPHRTRLSESWLEGFVECGAVTIDKSYPHGFVAAVTLPEK